MKFTRWWLLVFDMLLVIAAFYLAFAVRIPLPFLERQLSRFGDLLLPLLVLRLFLFVLFGLYRNIWADSAKRETVAVLSAVTAGSVLATAALVIASINSPIHGFPRLVLLYEWGLTLALVAGMRYSLRVLDMRLMKPEEDEDDHSRHELLRERLEEWVDQSPPEIQRMWLHMDDWSFRRFGKRLFDIVAALIAIVIISPILLLTAILIKLDSPGPILADIPMRAGHGGRPFKMYKFRSMVQNAHLMLVNNPELWERYKKNDFKLMDEDPRLTRVGKFIRKTSIDELPQLFNVLHGELSIVGPRARYPFEVMERAERFPHTIPAIVKILSVRPGITGPWQVGGRSNIGYEERTQLEADYAQEHTLLKDIIICLKTFRAVTEREGAH